ncbi:MAG TPA: hypothetical protein VEZ19_12905 [Rubrobacter sp.]|nr:hypothetical protein [Rubrobacter sp.]
MGFEESALTRLRRYRQEADRSLELAREAEEVARGFSERLFAGLEYTATLGRQAGFEIETTYATGVLDLRVVAGPGSEARVSFGLLRGAAAETDEALMHEQLSRYSLEPSGYSGRILGWSKAAGEESCQTFAVYRDGVWKTKGLFVARARGRVEDPDEVLSGFCLRILGRLVDLAATTGGVGRRWADGNYALADYLEGKAFPRETRLPR